MKKWIIFSGTDWFRPSVTSTRQIMMQFKLKGYYILWVNPIAFKSPAVNSENRKSMRKKILNKLQTHLKFIRKADQGVYVLVPFYIPLFSATGDKINDMLIRLQIAVITFFLGIRIRETILWISGSFTLSPVLHKPFYRKIYQAADLISDFRTSNQALLKELRRKEHYLGTHVDLLFASSPNIMTKLEQLTGRQVSLLTHGVNFTHFNTAVEVNPFMLKVKASGLPVAGYFGTLSDANDKEVFRILAERGFSVVIIGKVLGDYSSLENLDNIYFTGPVDFKELPSYARAFDVCLLNWIMADWIYNSYPVKTLEYLAMGKPIVSCPIPVVKELFGSLVYFADTPEEYLEKALLALKENSRELSEARVSAAAEHTWESKFKTIESAIQ
ncbi:glycosyltransferase [Lentimicrobium sp.]|uniref:glycosyltransferase n=1 Tax=Lentimicrobium sp. TaxID=2034841 RepID=UPI00345EAE67